MTEAIMAKLSNYSFLVGTLIMVSSTLGCGGGSMQNGGAFASASLRVVVLNPSVGGVNVFVDGTMVNSNLPYEGNTGYVPIKAPGGQLSVAPLAPGPVAPFTAPLDLAVDSHNTFLLDGWAHFESSSSLLTDDTSAAPNSAAKLRIMDASLAAARDIYLLPAGSTPSGTPLVTFSTFNNATSYQTLAPGQYEVFVTKGGATLVMFDSGAISLAAGQNRTLVIFSDCQPTTCNVNVLTSLMLADLN
jgi:Domain of unknown function (DUF4397)